jgi:hypothetical protein
MEVCAMATEDADRQFEEQVKGTVTGYRQRRERAVAAVEQSAQAEEQAVARFNQLVESDILPIFNKTAELLKDSCLVEIHRHEYTAERPYAVSVEMVLAPKPDGPIRRLRQPSPKLEVCLEKKTFRAVLFTEYLRDAKLQVEKMDLSELTAEKLERSIGAFIAQIFH